MPKVEISSPKQMPLIPQTKWVYHVYLCVFFWFSELKQIGSATTNAKGPHQLFFLFVFVCHLFCISTWVCLRVCLLFLLLCSCEYYLHTRYKTCHKPRPGLYGPRVSCVHVRLATVTNSCPLWPPLWSLLACECICCIFLSNRGSACEFVDVVTCVSFNQKLQFQTPNIICETKYSRISNMQELHNKLLIAQTV